MKLLSTRYKCNHCLEAKVAILALIFSPTIDNSGKGSDFKVLEKNPLYSWGGVGGVFSINGPQNALEIDKKFWK